MIIKIQLIQKNRRTSTKAFGFDIELKTGTYE